MISRINFFKIVKAHYKTLRAFKQRTNRIYWKDFILFVVIPILASSALTWFDIDLKPQTSNLIAAISIIGGFLFNLLAIIYNSMSNLELDAKKSKAKERYVNEIHVNISYNILLSIFSVLFMILYNIDYPKIYNMDVIHYSLMFTCYYLLISFLLTLFMVLNRVFILLNKKK